MQVAQSGKINYDLLRITLSVYVCNLYKKLPRSALCTSTLHASGAERETQESREIKSLLRVHQGAGGKLRYAL